jgi:hypothetical protein
MALEQSAPTESQVEAVFVASSVEQIPELFPTYNTIEHAVYGVPFFDMGLIYDFEEATWRGHIKNHSRSQGGQPLKMLEIELIQGLPVSRELSGGAEELQPLTDFATRWFGQVPSMYVTSACETLEISVHYHIGTCIELVVCVSEKELRHILGHHQSSWNEQISLLSIILDLLVFLCCCFCFFWVWFAVLCTIVPVCMCLRGIL